MESYSDKELKDSIKRKTHIIESGLEEKKYTLKEIGEIIPGNLVLNDLQKKQNLYVNQNGQEVLGYSQEELTKFKDTFFNDFFHQDDIIDLFRQWEKFIMEKDTERVYSFFQRVKTCKENDWEWHFTTGKFRRNDLSNTIFISQSLREIPQMVKKFDSIIEEDDFYRENYKRFQTLTKREKEILAHIASGESSKLISDKLFISTLTVDTHRKRINKKLDIRNITELIKYAVSFGLIN